MDFRVLGALEVWDGDERVEISGRLHPKILAGLLLNAGRTVSLAWLVDLLWDDDPPKTARRQVQNAVAALRRQLDPVREGLIERVGQEYRVNIDDDELDLRRFENLERDARRLAGAGELASAVARFDGALDLWRGPALQGLPGRVFEAAAARINDKYLSTYEEYAKVALSVGLPEQVIETLQELVVVHPLRQRLHARLMHTLHQSNRTPEALRLFESLRDRLADELGLDPDGELKTLQVRILQGDPSLHPHSTNRSQHSINPDVCRPVPAELPTGVASFTGRDEQLATLDRLRDSGAQTGIVSAITGIGGVGKTALAVHWAHNRREDFPDGQLYINLRGFDERKPLTPHEAVSRLLRSMGHPANDVPSDIEDAAALYRSKMVDKRILLLLDNARTAEQVRPLLPNSPGSLAVITSRNRLSNLIETSNAQPVELNTLRPDESLDLLTELLGADALVDVGITRQLGRLCGYLPLALRIVAANHIQNPNQTLAELVDRLEGDQRLSQLNVDSDSATSIAAVFDLSHQTLSEDAQQVFHHLGLIPGDDFTESLAAIITSISAERVQSSLKEMSSAHLLDQHQPTRFRLHDLVRLYAKSSASQYLSQDARQESVNRIINWYADKSNPQVHEFNNIITACEAFSNHPQSWKLTRTFRLFANLGNNLDLMRQYAEKSLHIAVESHNLEAEIDVLITLGSIYDALGDNEKGIATCRTAARILPSENKSELHGSVLSNLGNLLYANGEYEEAEDYLRQALLIAEIAKDRTSEQIRSANLGRVYRGLGRFHEAKSHLLRSQYIATKYNKKNFLASVLVSLGYLYCDSGSYDDSLTVSRHALQVARELDAPVVIAQAMKHIGLAFQFLGRHQEALEQLHKALDIVRQENRVRLHIDVLDCIAEVHIDVGDHIQAHRCMTAALALTGAGPREIVGNAARARILCRVFSASGEYETALPHGVRACEIYRSRRDPLRLGRSLDALGDAYYGYNEPAKSLDCWTEALSIFTRLEVPEAPKLRAKLAALPLPEDR